ncbi:c-type cytochrome [Xanthobacter tagetidis]|nr:cytochrome c [Xanthobacter tagetidis]MBB6307658.1 mono/diheme cytochrome c family protein [Xanthobacter tagetidis]
MLGRLMAALACALALMLAGAPARSEPVLSLKADGAARTYTAAQLLARPDAVSVSVPSDIAYGGRATYRAVPVLALLAEAGIPTDAPIEVKALDGFIAHYPAGIFTEGGPDGARAFVAVEPHHAPWPKLKGKVATAGPFYIVWQNPKAGRVSSEHWAYQVASIESALDPLVRWPQIDVAPSLPVDAPARRGLTVFIHNCMPCHQMNGGGESTIGPDLNLPMNPTEYFQPAALHRLIRDPAAVRTWPERRMPGFDAATIPDRALDDLIAYLDAMRHRRK